MILHQTVANYILGSHEPKAVSLYSIALSELSSKDLSNDVFETIQKHPLNMHSLSELSVSALNWSLASFIWCFFTVAFWETVNSCLLLPALQHCWFQRPLSYPSFFSKLKFPDYFIIPDAKTISHLSYCLSPYLVLFVSGIWVFFRN